MTVAEKAMDTLPKTVNYYLGVGGVMAALTIIFGFVLTQRQLDTQHVQALLGAHATNDITEVTLKTVTETFKLKSTYPGLTLIVCGTLLGALIMNKLFRFRTQHSLKQGESNPGFTDFES